MRTGTQFRGTVGAGQTMRWYTYNWPAAWHVIWYVAPITATSGVPQITWEVQVERASADNITYWVLVTNLTGQPVEVEGRYAVLN